MQRSPALIEYNKNSQYYMKSGENGAKARSQSMDSTGQCSVAILIRNWSRLLYCFWTRAGTVVTQILLTTGKFTVVRHTAFVYHGARYRMEKPSTLLILLIFLPWLWFGWHHINIYRTALLVLS